MTCIRSSVLFWLAASTARLSGAACLDGTCASSVDSNLESNVRGKASLLQQNAVRAAPAQEVDGQAKLSKVKVHLDLKATLVTDIENQQLSAAQEAKQEPVESSKLKTAELATMLEEFDDQAVEADKAISAQKAKLRAPGPKAEGEAKLNLVPNIHDKSVSEMIESPKKSGDEKPPQIKPPQIDELASIKADTTQKAKVVAAAKKAGNIAEKAKQPVKAVDDTQPEADEPVKSALIDRAHNLIMGWSPRAACTATVYMFFVSAGMYTLEEQQRFPWVHDYREALEDSARPSESDMKNEQFLRFKIVRNPYTRAISNWVHQMGTNFSDNPEIQALAAEHGVNTDSNFLEWLIFIQKTGWRPLDQHSWPQFSQWERRGGRYDMILQLEDPGLQTYLDQINGFYGSSLAFETMHVSLAQAKDASQTASSQKSHKSPPPEEIYGEFPEAIDFVQWVYQEDFNAYGYSLDVTTVYGYEP